MRRSSGATGGWSNRVIRTAHPISPVRQFAAKLELVTRRTRRAFERQPRALRSDTAVSRSLSDEYVIDRWRDTVTRTREAYDQFEEKYEDLIDVVFAAAHEGVTHKREEAYREKRAWFLKNYDGVQRELTRYLTADPNDTAPSLWGRRSCDAFEALFLPSNLKTMLGTDGGHVIGRLNRTQAALAAWDNDIRHAEAAARG